MRPPILTAAWPSTFLLVLGLGGSVGSTPQDPIYRFQYAAKIVCANRDVPILGLVPQQTATTINIHNPTDSLAVIWKKLALTVPPGLQRPGKIIPLVRDFEQLQADEALATDCTDVARRAGIRTSFEGFVVIYSSRPLDVVGVYTVPGGIDVVPVAERQTHIF